MGFSVQSAPGAVHTHRSDAAAADQQGQLQASQFTTQPYDDLISVYHDGSKAPFVGRTMVSDRERTSATRSSRWFISSSQSTVNAISVV
jgi:hypothetical protein